MPDGPVMLVVEPPLAGRLPALRTYAAVALVGQRILAAELSRRLDEAGAAVTRLPEAPKGTSQFHWGEWFSAAARTARREANAAGRPVGAIGYAGAGAVALLDDEPLRELISPAPGQVVANNRYSADAFTVAGDLDSALESLSRCPTDNAAVRCLEDAGFGWRDLSEARWSRFDVDTPLDLALLRLARTLAGTRVMDGVVSAFLDEDAEAGLPAGATLVIPRLDEVGAVIRSRKAQLLVAGRIPSSAWAYLETESACRVRCFVEERGMRSSRDQVPHSLLADWLERLGPADLINELSTLADAVILDTRVLIAARAGSSDAATWPPEEDRYASDFLDHPRIETEWLKELTAAAAGASVPVLLGGHALVSDGLQLLVDAAWLGR
jgi:hypothetical protein